MKLINSIKESAESAKKAAKLHLTFEGIIATSLIIIVIELLFIYHKIRWNHNAVMFIKKDPV